MKTLKLIIFSLLLSVNLLAQTPKTIEADLLKSFKKINYWDEQGRTGNINAGDSLFKANDMFGKKLKTYTETSTASINLTFNLLKNAGLDIFTSEDNVIRIYSWDTWLGGTKHIFANVLQYKAGNKTKSSLSGDLEYGDAPFYSNLYTFKVGDKTYYLGVYGFIYSTKDAVTGIRVFGIENDKLNDDVKIIKTGSGLKSKINYGYDFFSVMDIPFEKRPTITFDQTTQIIHIPLVDAKGHVTKKFINYKFNGQYFEKIKG